jgi:nicotinamide-nucleotide amidase
LELLVDRLPEDVERAVKTLLERACDADLTIATAESCTGGLLAALLTDVEGCGHAFERGFVVYSEDAKADMLGIDRALIDREGAVSKAVALAMVNGALGHSAADIALAVTGFAGAAGPDDEPGLVHFACARRGRQAAHREAHFGDRGRGEVRLQAVRVAIDLMTAALD